MAEKIGSLQLQKLATDDQLQVDLKQCFRQAFCLNILVSGKTGVGKSSLINSLIGRNVCHVNDPGLEDGHMGAGTLKVSATQHNIDGVFVTIYDSPGLQDGTDHDDAYLEDMHIKCKDANLFLYCMDMAASRFGASDKQAIKLITKKFEHNFWERCVLVMTKANLVRVPPRERGKEREYHKRLYNTILSTFHKFLVDQDVPEEIVKAIPGVAAGHVDSFDEEELERYIWYTSNKASFKPNEGPVDFVAELLTSCLERSGSAHVNFVRAAVAHRFKPKPENSKADKMFMKEYEELESEYDKCRKQYEQEIAKKKENPKFKEDLEEIKEEFSPEKWPSAELPKRPVYVSPSADQYKRMTKTLIVARASIAVGGGIVGGVIGSLSGPIGTVLGVAAGAALGNAVGALLGFGIKKATIG